MSDERIWYESGIETLCKVAKQRCSPTTKTQLEASGFKLDGPYSGSCEAGQYARALTLAATDAFPQLTAPEATFKWGAVAAETFFGTLVGKSLRPLIRALGPHRYFGGAKRFAKQANNFQHVTAEQLAPHSYRVTVDDPDSGFVTLGGVYASLEQLKLTGLKYRLVEGGAGVASCEIEWAS